MTHLPQVPYFKISRWHAQRTKRLHHQRHAAPGGQGFLQRLIVNLKQQRRFSRRRLPGRIHVHIVTVPRTSKVRGKNKDTPHLPRILPHLRAFQQMPPTFAQSYPRIRGDLAGGRRRSEEKSKYGTFPRRLEIPQKRRDSHYWNGPPLVPQSGLFWLAGGFPWKL